jgi:hypothetical protein
MPQVPYKAPEVFNCQSLYEALPTDELDYSNRETPLPIYRSLATHDYTFFKYKTAPSYQYPDESTFNNYALPPMYTPAPSMPCYNSFMPRYGPSYANYASPSFYNPPPVYGSNMGYGVYNYGYTPYGPSPAYNSPPFYSTPPLYGVALNSAPTPPISKPYHEYGDCGETLPFPTMLNVCKLAGKGEIRSLAVFSSVFRNMPFIPMDGPITGIKLKDPCLNCKALMQTIPNSISVLAGTGAGLALDWTVEGGLDIKLHEPSAKPTGYDLALSAAYSATKAEIYHTLEMWTVRNTSPLLSVSQKQSLATLWKEFIVPFRLAPALSFFPPSILN